MAAPRERLPFFKLPSGMILFRAQEWRKSGHAQFPQQRRR
jgi:hypothetical protein